MTNVAVLSDIHGNIDALNAVFADMKDHSIDYLIVCGDITGYYYDTYAVWQEINRWDAFMCRGNHEDILAQWINGDKSDRARIFEKYGSSYELACQTMPSEEMDKLINLKHPLSLVIDDKNICISHGSPWDEDVYLYPDMNSADKNRILSYKEEYDAVFLGHTHYPNYFIEDDFLVLNPGSVGQPRSGKKSSDIVAARAHWAIYDTSTNRHTQMTSYYDPSRIFAQIGKYDPHLTYLKDVFFREEPGV